MTYKYKPDANHRFFIHDPDGGETLFFATAAERDAHVGQTIRSFHDGREWMDGVEAVFMGEVTATVAEKPTGFGTWDFEPVSLL